MSENLERDVRFRDLFKKIKMADQLIKSDVEVPDSFYETLLSEMLERGYLNETANQVFQPPKPQNRQNMWMRITRLPLHPDNEESFDLFYHWQSVLATMHAWGYRLQFLLLRYQGETRLYLGTTTASAEVGADTAMDQLYQATATGMPGIGLKPIDSEDKEALDEQILTPLADMRYAGAVTGLPSFRMQEEQNVLQTLDQLAFGVRGKEGDERDFALLVIAEPLSDEQISDMIERYRALGSKIHSAVSRTVSETQSSSESKKAGAGVAAGILGSLVDTMIFTLSGGIINTKIFRGIGASLERSISLSASTGVTTQYLDRFAQYAEKMTQMHENRLLEGRNLGFWNTGVYVLGATATDVVSVTGLLRSIYAGKESYLEPIRTHLFSPESHALQIIRRMELIPAYQGELPRVSGIDVPDDEWHMLGKNYQYISTPINTKELGLVTSLPRRDVPGLRFTKTAVRFANNPAEVNGDTIEIGRVVDMGVEQNNVYRIDPNALVRHALVAGSTGSGKSTTCKRILSEMLKRKVPVLVIEPAKDDYVRWALEQNKYLPKEQQFTIYMPGLLTLGQTRDPAFQDLQINPFQPAAVSGAPIDLLSHSEVLTSILNASLPSSDVLPTIIDETVYTYMDQWFGRVFEEITMPQQESYPRLDGILDAGLKVLQQRSYAAEVRDNLKGCLETRFRYLTRGTRGRLLNNDISTDFEKLFDRNVIINVSRIGGDKDKALIMALLMLDLYEYRKSAYEMRSDFREQAQGNKLMHLALVEEAHNLLRKPVSDMMGSGDPQRVVAEYFGNILSEIRGYGQGFMIVDQIPTRLIEDAIKNTNYKITHRLTAPDDCEVMAAGMSLREDQKHIISALEIGNAIICGDQDDAAAWVKVRR